MRKKVPPAEGRDLPIVTFPLAMASLWSTGSSITKCDNLNPFYNKNSNGVEAFLLSRFFMDAPFLPLQPVFMKCYWPSIEPDPSHHEA